MALKHIDDNFTQSSIELSTNFLQALTALKYTYIHRATENTLEKQINIYFRDGLSSWHIPSLNMLSCQHTRCFHDEGNDKAQAMETDNWDNCHQA